MDTIESLIEQFVAGSLRIDCSGITFGDAYRIDDLLSQYTDVRSNDEEFERADGSTDYASYIRYYYVTYPYLGTTRDDDDEYTMLCMWRKNTHDIRLISFEDFLNSVDVKEVPIEGFDELFE